MNVVITFPANSQVGAVQCATFTINDDNIMELTEVFNVQATGGDFAQQATTTQVSIIDNDSKLGRGGVKSREGEGKERGGGEGWKEGGGE
jgi:hypothetical protein